MQEIVTKRFDESNEDVAACVSFCKRIMTFHLILRFDIAVRYVQPEIAADGQMQIHHGEWVFPYQLSDDVQRET